MLTSFVVITCVSLGIFITGLLYVAGLNIKVWLLDGDELNWDRRKNNGLLRLPTMPKVEEVTWWAGEWAPRCLLLWVGLVALWLSYFLIWIFLSIAATAAIVGGLYFTRWAIRLKKSLGKLKLSSHEHGETA